MEMIPGVNHEHLVRLARRLVGPDDAEDVVQTAYLKAHRASGEFRGECQASTWLHRITSRCALDLLRTRKRRPEVHMTTPAVLAEIEGTLDPETGERSDVAEAERRLAALPPLWREALQAVVQYDSTADAAAALGVTTSTLKKRLHNARTSLRQVRA
jgi:RNA polymerase sigma factor (sigma-70 family)